MRSGDQETISQKPDGPARLPAIEGLRGLAMTLVFFGHFEGLFRRYLPVNGWSIQLVDFLRVIGHQGVCFFLVLSGYFVYRGYLGNPGGYFSFAARRLRRIYPPYVAMLGLYLVLSAIFPSESKIPSGHALSYIAANLMMISSRPMIIVSWTIGTLLTLYTLVPLFWTAVRFERWKPVYRVAFLLASVAVWYSVPRSTPMLDQRAAFVFVGFALHEAILAGAQFRKGGEFPGLAILACGYLLWYANDRGWMTFLHLPDSWNYYTYLAPGLFYVCGHILRCQGRLAAALECAGLPRLGRMSYSYYLCHGMIVKGALLVASALLPHTPANPAIFWIALPVAYACTLVAAWAWFQVVELPLAAFVGGGRTQSRPAAGSPAPQSALPVFMTPPAA